MKILVGGGGVLLIFKEQHSWRASEASETLLGLFNRESYIY